MGNHHKKYDIMDAKASIMRYCAYQERSQEEVKEKLEKMGLIPLAVDMIMVELIENNYVNELRFAESFARGKFRQKGWGKIKIREKLRQRKVSPQCIDLALTHIDDEEYTIQLQQLAEWKWRKVSAPNDLIRKQKVMTFLYGRGFEYDLIKDSVDGLTNR
jgi:regulatory protein